MTAGDTGRQAANRDRNMGGRAHIVGIGGVGMSALAQALLDEGLAVSGSDRLLDAGGTTETLECLARQGATLRKQDGSGVDAGVARMVVSTAIEEDNPDWRQARACGVPVIHRANELARLVANRRLIAVTGTCGKSTVTALLGWILEAAGLDPLVVNGAAVSGWDLAGARIGSVRRGGSAWAVIEADESDRSLLAFHPEHAVITNASADHFGLAETEALFDRFKGQVAGVVIDGRVGDPVPPDLELSGWDGFFTWAGTRFRVPMPGAHNVVNAWQAARLALELGVSPHALAAALAGFGGVARRLQRIGCCGEAVVIDDYAHNPVKLEAAWQTLAAAFPRGICAVWRPHGYAPLRKMLKELAVAFARVCRPVDLLLLLPVYDAGGTADRDVESEDLALLLSREGVRVKVVPGIQAAEARMRAEAGAGRALVTFGARDPGLPRLARQLAGKT